MIDCSVSFRKWQKLMAASTRNVVRSAETVVAVAVIYRLWHSVKRMLVEITKRADGAGVLRCVRDDGSVTWQKQTGRHAAFFALHDLTHFAVETALGCRRGFFGLVAEGWQIEDTTGKGSRGPLPEEAAKVEHIVGMFDSERANGAIWTLEEFNEFGGPAARGLTLEQIGAIRKRRSELFQKWSAVPAGEILRLHFPV
jgi:hypothetical protein